MCGLTARFAIFAALGLSVVIEAQAQSSDSHAEVVARAKASIVAVGTFQKTRAPRFRFLGTGFAVADGTLIATNAHVIPGSLEAGADPEILVVALPTGDTRTAQFRLARRVAASVEHDLALLRIEGTALPALSLRDSDTVKEGEQYVFTGFPIGSALGLFPATHRAMIAAITPIAIPPPTTRVLDSKLLLRLQAGAFPIFQLDATAFPGHSGSPVYDPEIGKVVAIINMVFVKGTKESMLSEPSGISYAIPSNRLSDLLSSVR